MFRGGQHHQHRACATIADRRHLDRNAFAIIPQELEAVISGALFWKGRSITDQHQVTGIVN